jgi:hypothetical protein
VNGVLSGYLGGIRSRPAQIRSQRFGREMLFPQPRGKLRNTSGWMLSDSLQQVDEIRVGVGVDAVQTAGYNQTLRDSNVFGTEFGPAEVP